MKKNFNKKLVLKKHTVASLDAEQLKALHGGLVDPSFDPCGGGGGGTGGTGGYYPTYTCGDICTVWSWYGRFTCPC